MSIFPAHLPLGQNQSIPASQTPIHAERNEVEVVVIVRDSRGEPVATLKEGDFQILDNGKRQLIRSFSLQQSGSHPELEEHKESDSATSTSSKAALQRRFIGLFFDDVNTEAGDFSRVQKAGEQFVQKDLQPEDRVAIFKASEHSTVSTFSNNTSKLLAEIEAMTTHPLGFQTRTSDCPKLSAHEAWVVHEGTDPQALQVLMNRIARCFCPPPASSCEPPPPQALRSMAQATAEGAWNKARFASQMVFASLDSAVRLLATMQGPRVLVLASSGFLTGDLEHGVNIVIDNALRGGVSVNALSAKGLAMEASDQNANQYRNDYDTREQSYEHQEMVTRAMAEEAAMTDVAESTGGKFYRNNNDLLGGFLAVASPETAYVLSFSPEPLKHDGKFHKLKVEVKTSGRFSISARQGYFAPTEKEMEAVRARPAAEPPTNATAISPSGESSTSVVAPNKPEAQPTASDATRVLAQPSGQAPVTSQTSPEPVTSASPDALANAASPARSATPTKTAEELAAQRASEVAFLDRASHEVEHYIETFADLTAEETREMETFGSGGHSSSKRAMNAALVVYRLRTDPRLVIEFRDVASIDGKEIKGHAERAARMWGEIAKARKPIDEIKLIRQDSERYDIGFEETGFTLYEGLPLQSRCAGDFVFAELPSSIENGRSIRNFQYQQTRPCEVIAYHLASQSAGTPELHAGQIALDAVTAQIIREERSVYLGSLQGPRAVRVVLGYAESPFGLLLPKIIVIELFGPPERVSNPLYVPPNMHVRGGSTEPHPAAVSGALLRARFALHARLVQSYGPFSRFEVSVVEKTSASTH